MDFGLWKSQPKGAWRAGGRFPGDLDWTICLKSCKCGTWAQSSDSAQSAPSVLKAMPSPGPCGALSLQQSLCWVSSLLYFSCRGYTRPGQKVSSHVQWKIETFIEQDTRYKKHCTQDNVGSVAYKVDTLGPRAVLPITKLSGHSFLNLIDNLKSLPFQRWF